MTSHDRLHLRQITFGVLVLAGVGCSSSSELRDRGGTVSTPTVISTGDGGSLRIDTQTEQGGRTETLVMSADSAFAHLSGVYGRLGIETPTLVTRERTIGNPEVVARRQLAGERPSRFFECGSTATGVALADSYEIRMAILTQVVPADDGTGSLITTRASATARPVTSGGNQVTCRTKGEIERRIAQNLRIAAAPR